MSGKSKTLVAVLSRMEGLLAEADSIILSQREHTMTLSGAIDSLRGQLARSDKDAHDLLVQADEDFRRLRDERDAFEVRYNVCDRELREANERLNREHSTRQASVGEVGQGTPSTSIPCPIPHLQHRDSRNQVVYAGPQTGPGTPAESTGPVCPFGHPLTYNHPKQEPRCFHGHTPSLHS